MAVPKKPIPPYTPIGRTKACFQLPENGFVFSGAFFLRRLSVTGGEPAPSRRLRVAGVFQRSTRADPPPTSFFTSSTVAMVVSPGVVMASAPWAAPYSTAMWASSNSMKP